MMRTTCLVAVAVLCFTLVEHVTGSIVETKQVLAARTKRQLRAALQQESRNLQNDAPESLPVLADQFDNIPGFYHGVASGDPLPTAVILWTRYTPLTWEESVQLELRIAEVDERLARESLLDPELNPALRYEAISVDQSTDFTAKIDLTGLTPNTHYVYAFTVGSDETFKSSQVGQTRTAPDDTEDVEKMTYGLMSCTVYTNGYFHAYDAVSTVQDLDFWIHIGDYIYEYGADALYASDSKEREAELQPPWETVSLQDYRLRYALYRTDEALQNLHRRAPMIAVWDDHEVADNSYGQGSASNSGANNHQEICIADMDSPEFLQIAAMCQFDEGSIVDRMQGATRAYMEWLPIRRAPGTLGVVEDQGSLTKSMEWGNLATYVTFESRISNRSEEPTLASVFSEFADFAASNTNVTAYTDPESPVKAELDAIASSVTEKMYDPKFTMVGSENIAFLKDAFETSKSAGKIWQLYGSSTLMGPNVIINPADLWMYVPESIQAQVRTKMDELLANDTLGNLLRILTAMSVTLTPWNRDDFNGFADERAQILDICRDSANNALVLGGDLHDSWAWIMYDGGALSGTPPVAVNIGAPGVTAPGIGEDLFAQFEPIDELLQDVDGAYIALQNAWVDLNEGLVHAQIRNRGFVVATVTKEKHVVEFHHISAENLLTDYTEARAANGGGLTSAYFCSGQYATTAGSPGSLVREGEECNAAVFNTTERPWQWSIPVPEKITVGSSPTVSPPFSCQTVTTQEGFDLDLYISARWYSQQQRPSPFQPASLNYCTTADYTKIEASELGFMDDYTIKVFNTAQDVDGNIFTSDDEAQVGPDPGPLCGLQENPIVDPAKLLVGNCFVDPSLPFGSGPYWVLEYDETAGYALISGGQPDVPTQNGLCSYSSPFSGLWIFTRDSERNDTLIEEVRAMAVAQGIDPSVMLDVNQESCEYPEFPTPAPPTLAPPVPTAAPPSPNVVTLTPKNYKGCIQVNGKGVDNDKLVLATCDASDPRQQFVFDGNVIKLALDMSKCFQAGRNNPEPSHGHFLRVFTCDPTNAQQLFTWDAPNGALTLVEFPSLAVVFQGVNANVNKDMIIIGDLDKESVEARKEWVILN